MRVGQSGVCVVRGWLLARVLNGTAFDSLSAKSVIVVRSITTSLSIDQTTPEQMLALNTLSPPTWTLL